MTFTKWRHRTVPAVQQALGHRRSGLGPVTADDLRQPAPVVDVEGLEGHHVGVGPPGQAALGVVDVGDPARHTGAEIPSRRAEHHHPAAGHVFAPVVAHAFDHGGGPRVTDAEPLPHLAPDEDFTGRRPVEDDVAGDDLVLGREG